MKDDLIFALETLEKGGVILYPTDTVWGLGCDATNNEAVLKVFEIKKRNDSRQMLILVAKPSEIKNYVKEVPEIAYYFIEEARKPLSIIFQNAKNLAASLVGHDNTIGIRVVQDDFCKALIEEFGKPIVSTSANISGSPPPANYSAIEDVVKNSVDYIVQWRREDINQSPPSDIIKFGEDGEIIKIR